MGSCQAIAAAMSNAATPACPIWLFTPTRLAPGHTRSTPMCETLMTRQVYYESVAAAVLEQQPDLIDIMLRRLIAGLPRDAAAEAELSAGSSMDR